MLSPGALELVLSEVPLGLGNQRKESRCTVPAPLISILAAALKAEAQSAKSCLCERVYLRVRLGGFAVGGFVRCGKAGRHAGPSYTHRQVQRGSRPARQNYRYWNSNIGSRLRDIRSSAQGRRNSA